MTARLSCVWRSLNGDPRRPDPAPRGVARAAGARRLGRAPVPTFARGRAGAPPSGSRARRAGGGRTRREPDDRSGNPAAARDPRACYRRYPRPVGGGAARPVGAVATISLGLADTLSFALPLAAIAGAFASVFLLLGVVGRNASLLILILAGLAISSMAGAATALAMNLAPNPFAALEIAFWLLGSLEDRSLRHVTLALPFILAGGALLFRQRHAFRVLTLGEEAAQSLGVDVARLRLSVIVGVALGVGASVAVAGTIGFIGLVSPHLVRPLVGHDPARLLGPSALAGACLLLAADVAVRIIPATTDIKVSVLTALIGVPFFLYLIVRERRSLGAGAA